MRHISANRSVPALVSYIHRVHVTATLIYKRKIKISNPLKPTVAISVQLLWVLWRQTGLSRHL